MTTKQNQVFRELQQELKEQRRIIADLEIREVGGLIFTEVNGVTITIGPAGGIELPAVRTYVDPLSAAINADIVFRAQRERDDADPSRARTFRTGHLNPRLDSATLRCVGDRTCARCEQLKRGEKS